MPTYCGNIDLDDTWKKVGSAGVVDGVEWLVFIRAEPNQYGWHMIKTASVGYAKSKANYWLTWDGTRIAKSREMAVMCTHRPELAKRVVELLGGTSLDVSEHKFEPGLKRAKKTEGEQ